MSSFRILLLSSDSALGDRFRAAVERSSEDIELFVEPELRPGGQRLELDEIQAAFYDLRTGASGLDELRQRLPYAAVIVPDDTAALTAFRSGASDYLFIDATENDIEDAFDRCFERTVRAIAYLEYRSPSGDLRTAPLFPGSRLRIGRDVTNDLSFESQVVSRFHARVGTDGGDLWILDLDSRHGVYVNDRKIEGRAVLSDEDEI
ncbi:MAG: FHA domain-containing protein, partial [Planctomycetota bacterium]